MTAAGGGVDAAVFGGADAAQATNTRDTATLSAPGAIFRPYPILMELGLPLIFLRARPACAARSQTGRARAAGGPPHRDTRHVRSRSSGWQYGWRDRRPTW